MLQDQRPSETAPDIKAQVALEALKERETLSHQSDEKYFQMRFIAGAVAVFVVACVAITNAVFYQRNAEAATQAARVDEMRQWVPRFVDSTKYKELRKMSVVKISQDELPATIVVPYDNSGDRDVSIDQGCSEINQYPTTDVSPYHLTGIGTWEIFSNAAAPVSSEETPNGWTVTFSYSGGTYDNYCGEEDWLLIRGFTTNIQGEATISIPAGVDVGEYNVTQWLGMDSGGIDDIRPPIDLWYKFKITPPCPTSVTLSATPAS